MCEFIGVNMKKIEEINAELKVIMQDSGISQTAVVNALDGKCSRNTVLTFLKGGEDCKLSTLLMILDACGVELRLETERSREAIMAGDIAAYRTETEKLRSENEHFKARSEELTEKNAALTRIVEKQQDQIERYMNRMENAENAVYKAMEDIRRKDARIVELSKESKRW